MKMDLIKCSILNDVIYDLLWDEGIDGNDETIIYVKSKLPNKFIYYVKRTGDVDKKIKKKLKKIVKKKSNKLFKISLKD